jgi:hypothetical protein
MMSKLPTHLQRKNLVSYEKDTRFIAAGNEFEPRNEFLHPSMKLLRLRIT